MLEEHKRVAEALLLSKAFCAVKLVTEGAIYGFLPVTTRRWGRALQPPDCNPGRPGLSLIALPGAQGAGGSTWG